MFAPWLLLVSAAPPPPAPPGGEVVMPLPAYEQLLEAAAGGAPRAPEPPVHATVRQAKYSVNVTGTLARVQMTARVDVLGTERQVQPLLGSAGALLGARVDGKPAGASLAGDRYAVALAPGSHVVEMEVVVPVASEGPSELALAVPSAVAAQLTAELPGRGWQVQVGGAPDVAVRAEGARTTVSTALGVTETLSMSWVRGEGEAPDEELPDEKPDGAAAQPGKARATVLHEVAVDETVLRGTVRVTATIQKGTRTSMVVALPSGVEVLDVTAPDLREWNAAQDGDRKRVNVVFRYGRTGEVPLTLRYEQAIKEAGDKATVQVPEPVVEEMESERGFVGVEAAPGVEVSLSRVEGGEAMDGRDLPSDLWSMAGTPLVLGVKYLEHPVSVALGVSRRAKVAVADTTVDRAVFETVVNAEGRSVSAVTWHVRNHQRQFLEVKMPAKAAVLTCFVGGKPVRPARGADDALFIPLDRSTAAEGAGAAFPVELVFAREMGKLWPVSSLALEMPATGVQAMELTWRVFVPSTHVGVLFGGNFSVYPDPRRMERWLASVLSTAPDAQAGELLKTSKALEGYDMSQGVKARWAPRPVAEQAAAAVRVSRPLVGRAYDFRANLLRAEAPRLRMGLVKFAALESLGTILALLALMGAWGLAERFRRRRADLRLAPPPDVGDDRLGGLPAWVLPSMVGGALLLALPVGLIVDGVVGDVVLAAVAAPAWLVGVHLRVSLRPGNRWWGWPVWAVADLLLVGAVVSGVAARSPMGALMLLGPAAVCAWAARRALWKPVSTTAPPSGTPVAAASSAEPAGGAA
ncbi:MAG: hypothetical protein HY904_24270 [Deltaproteobacteria bacterium]|nr:hypothetical protein [Deltaproteobacteria bacterium]